MRLDVERKPAFGGTIRHPLFLQRVGWARPLENHEAGKSAWFRRLADLAAHVRAVDVVHREGGVIDTRSVAGGRFHDGMRWYSLQQSDLRGPEAIEINRARNGRRDSLRRHGRTHNNVVSSARRCRRFLAVVGVAALAAGVRSGLRRNLHVHHRRLVHDELDGRRAAG